MCAKEKTANPLLLNRNDGMNPANAVEHSCMLEQGVCLIREFTNIREKLGKLVMLRTCQGKSGNSANAEKIKKISDKMFVFVFSINRFPNML